MPHVEPLNIENAPEAAQPILKAIKAKFGKSLNIFSTMAYQPDVLAGVTTLNDGLQNDLPAKFRELAYFKASHMNSCTYCSHYHKQAAKNAGISEQQLDAMDGFADSDAFDDQEKAVLSYTEQLTRTAGVDEATVQELKSFLDDTSLVTLAAAVSLANFTNRFNHALGIELP